MKNFFFCCNNKPPTTTSSSVEDNNNLDNIQVPPVDDLRSIMNTRFFEVVSAFKQKRLCSYNLLAR